MSQCIILNKYRANHRDWVGYTCTCAGEFERRSYEVISTKKYNCNTTILAQTNQFSKSDDDIKVMRADQT